MNSLTPVQRAVLDPYNTPVLCMGCPCVDSLHRQPSLPMFQVRPSDKLVPGRLYTLAQAKGERSREPANFPCCDFLHKTTASAACFIFPARFDLLQSKPAKTNTEKRETSRENSSFERWGRERCRDSPPTVAIFWLAYRCAWGTLSTSVVTLFPPAK